MNGEFVYFYVCLFMAAKNDMQCTEKGAYILQRGETLRQAYERGHVPSL